MIELVQIALLGGIVGIICGLIPGVGMLVGIAILYPFLLDFQPVELLVFYISMVCSAQYFGSITAIYLGIAGEASSFPAVIEGYSLSKQGKGQQSIFLTGVGSFIGTMFGLLFIAVLSVTVLDLTLTTLEKMILFMIVGLSLILTTKNKLLTDLSLIVLALGLSHIGVSINSNIPLFHFDLIFLSQGISYFTLAAGLLCMKEVLHAEKTNTKIIVVENYNAIKELVKHKYSIIRGSIIGSIGGMLPGLTTISASHLAYMAEKRVHKNTYKKGNTHCLTSSETANNSGSITQLFPLLMFGIPITGSEAIIYQMLEMKGWEGSATQPLALLASNWWILVGVNVIMLVLAIRFAKHFVKLIPSNDLLLKLGIFFILLIVVYVVGDKQTGFGLFNVVLFLFTTVIAYLFPKVNFLPFVFWMCIGDIWLENFYTFLQIYEIY
jgi:putative tricarboxylic transport membrane protein